MTAPKADLPRLLTAPVAGIIAVNLVFFSAYLFFFPTLPFFIERLGGKESEIGLLIGISSLTSLAVRPFVGYFIDSVGRKPVLLAGLAIFIVNCLLYNVVTSPAAVLPLRLLTGASLATTVTAASTYIADVAPAERRGEAISYFGLANALGFAIGPALGGFIIHAGFLSSFDAIFTDRFDWLAGARTGELHFTTLFLAATAMGAAAFVIVLAMPESRPGGATHARRPHMSDLVAREALFLAVISFATSFSFAGMVTFLPLFARDLGLENPGNLFVVYAAFVILMRLTIGRRMDTLPRGWIIIPGIAALVVTMLLVSAANAVWVLFVAAGIWGAGAGVFQPGMMAYVVDKSPLETRGRAMSTFTMGNDLGISLGSLALGIIVETAGFRAAYVVAAAVVLAGLLLFTVSWLRRPSRTRRKEAPLAPTPDFTRLKGQSGGR